jgi:ribokinase
LKSEVICFGALNIDRLCRVERIAGPGEESFIFDREDHPGGSAANTAVGLSRLGISTGYIGKMATDDEGKILLKNFKDEGVTISGIINTPQGRSGVVTGFVDKTGERTLYVDPGINDTLIFEDIKIDYVSNADFLHMTSFVGQKPFDAQKRIVKNLFRTKISFDPGEMYVRKGIKALRPIINRSYVLFLNEKELEILTKKEIEKGALSLLDEGVKIVFVKRGKKGCYVINNDVSYFLDPYEVEVIDTTGAGDAFCAGVLFGLIKNKKIDECGRIGNFVASCCISHIGARNGLPKLEELEEVFNF